MHNLRVLLPDHIIVLKGWTLVASWLILITAVGTASEVIVFDFHVSFTLRAIALLHLDDHAVVLVSTVGLHTRADLSSALMRVLPGIEWHIAVLITWR